MDVLLLQKANKQSVANALQRKANKTDLSALEKTFNEIGDISNFSGKFEEIKVIIDRQKESYVDLL